MFFYLNVMWYVGPTPTQCCILSVFKIQNRTRNIISRNILYYRLYNDIIFFCWRFTTFRVHFKMALKLKTSFGVEMKRWNQSVVSTWSVYPLYPDLIYIVIFPYTRLFTTANIILLWKTSLNNLSNCRFHLFIF